MHYAQIQHVCHRISLLPCQQFIHPYIIFPTQREIWIPVQVLGLAQACYLTRRKQTNIHSVIHMQCIFPVVSCLVLEGVLQGISSSLSAMCWCNVRPEDLETLRKHHWQNVNGHNLHSTKKKQHHVAIRSE